MRYSDINWIGNQDPACRKSLDWFLLKAFMMQDKVLIEIFLNIDKYPT